MKDDESLSTILHHLLIYIVLVMWYHGNLRAPPECHPTQEIRDYSGTMMVRNPLTRHFLGGGMLNSHDSLQNRFITPAISNGGKRGSHQL